MKYVRVLGCFIQNKDDEYVYKINEEFTRFFTKTWIPLNESCPIYSFDNSYEVDDIMHAADFPDYIGEDEVTYRIASSLHQCLELLSQEVICGKLPPEAKEGEDFCSMLRDGLKICPFAAHYGPFYMFPYKPKKKANAHQDETELWWCIVHPDERDRMERILGGTDNPLHDLVHELRYNPNISFEREEAKRDFESKKQRIV